MNEESDFISFVRRGWIEVGGARMALVEIQGGFYGLREVLAREVGDTEDDLVCHAGNRGSTSFVMSAMESGQLTPDDKGFRNALDTYSEAGFGNFEIAELLWSRGWAIIHCKDSFEGWAYVQNQNLQGCPKCDYTRGVLLAFMSKTHMQAKTGVEEILIVESTCIAMGNEKCEFIIGTRADLEACGYELAPAKASVREKLERTVALLRDSNKRLMRAEMQYRSMVDVTFDAIMIVDHGLSVLNCNETTEELLDAKRGTMVGKEILEYFTAAQRLPLKERFREAVSLNKCIEFEVDAQNSRGETLPCKARISPIHGGLAIVFHRIERTKEQ